MLKALEQSESLFSRYYLNEDFNDIKFDFELRDDIVIGQPFSYVTLTHATSNNHFHIEFPSRAVMTNSSLLFLAESWSRCGIAIAMRTTR